MIHLVPQLQQVLAWPIAHLYFRARGSFAVRGREHFKDLPPGVIFAANHTSQFDPIAVRAAMPWFSEHTPLYYVARKRDDYQWKGWRGIVFSDWFFRSWGALPAYRGRQDYAYSLQHFLPVAEQGESICIFPQGMEIEGRERNEPRGGVAYLSHRASVPIIPVHITPVHKRNRGRLGRYHITVTFGAPLWDAARLRSDEGTVTNYKQTARKVCESIRALSD